jgi:hypothetical protein
MKSEEEEKEEEEEEEEDKLRPSVTCILLLGLLSYPEYEWTRCDGTYISIKRQIPSKLHAVTS